MPADRDVFPMIDRYTESKVWQDLPLAIELSSPGVMADGSNGLNGPNGVMDDAK